MFIGFILYKQANPPDLAQEVWPSCRQLIVNR